MCASFLKEDDAAPVSSVARFTIKYTRGPQIQISEQCHGSFIYHLLPDV